SAVTRASPARTLPPEKRPFASPLSPIPAPSLFAARSPASLPSLAALFLLLVHLLPYIKRKSKKNGDILSRHQFITPGVKPARATAKLEGEPRPQRRVMPLRVQIPTGAARGPHRPGHPPLHLSIERLLAGRPHLHCLHALPIHRAQRVQHVRDLRFDHIHH